MDFLKKSARGRLAHAYLFSGSENLGKRAVAFEFARMLDGAEIDQPVHPDILIVEPQITEKDGVRKEAEIGIDQAKVLQHNLSLSPYRAPYKIAIIDQPDRLTAEAGNCLLKTIEEPTGKSVIVLITSRPKMVLSTIVSRCQMIRFFPVPAAEIKAGLPKATDEMIRLANGRPGLATQYLADPHLLTERKKIAKELENLLGADLNERLKYAEEMARDTASARQTLKIWSLWFRDRLLADCAGQGAARLAGVIRAIRRTDDLLTNTSFNSRLALEVLMLKI